MVDGPSSTGVELEKVIALFEGPNSADLYERHVAAIGRLCRANPTGFAVRDLPKVQQVMELSMALLKRGSMCFLEPLCELISALAKPFIRRTSTDEFKMLNHITNILGAVGDVFRAPGQPAQLQVAAAQMIAAFASAYGNRPNALELTAPSPEPDTAQRQYHTNQGLIHKSGVVADLITALARCLVPPASPAPGVAAPARPAPNAAEAVAVGALPSALCSALLALSHHSDNCTAMVEAGVLQCLAALIGLGARSDTSCSAVELLWNVVENTPAANEALARPLPPVAALARGAALPPGSPNHGVEASPLASQSPRTDEPAADAGPSPRGSDSASGAIASESAANGSGVAAVSSLSGWAANGRPASRVGSQGGREALGSRGAPRSRAGASREGRAGGGAGAPGSLAHGDSAASAGGRSSVSLGSAFPNGHHDWAGAPQLEGAPGDVYRPSGDGEGTDDASSTTSPSARGTEDGAPATSDPSDNPNSSSSPDGPDPALAPVPVVQTLADALTALLCWLLRHGFSAADKELRNDVMVGLSHLLRAEAFRSAAAYAGLFDALLAAGTCPEVGQRPELVAACALSTDVLDQELRLLVWGALEQGCLLPDVLAACVAGGFVRVLLLYVTPGEEGYHLVRRWNADQLAVLRAAALSKLHTLSPLCPDEYERAGGPGALLAFVASGPGPGPCEGALRHLHRLFCLVPEMRDALGAAGLIPVLLGIVQDTLGSGAGGGALGNHTLPGVAGGPGQPEPVRHFALLCLTVLCSVHAENQRRLRKAGGCGVLLAALSRLRGLDPLLPSPYAVAVLDCCWAALVPDRKSAARFLVDGGLGGLLQQLEAGNRAHRPCVLRVLSDLLENPRAHAFFHDWQSDANKQTAAHLLLNIWREEDALRGLSGPDGLLSNTARPLVGMDKRTRWLPAENVAYGNISPAKKETLQVMLDSCGGEAVLAKVYGCLKLLGFDRLSYLGPADQAALAAVEKYAKFRQGEVWRGIGEELGAEGLRATAPDRERLASGIELAESLAAAVREAQARLQGRAAEGARAAEARLFDGLRSQAKLEAEYRTIALQQERPLTLAEMRRAKETKATMLKSSMQSFQFQHGADD